MQVWRWLGRRADVGVSKYTLVGMRVLTAFGGMDLGVVGDEDSECGY